MWDAHDGMGWWMLFGTIFWVVVVGTFLYVAATLSGRNAPPAERGTESALDVARRRYAAGEISEDEFQRIKRNLGL